MNTLRPLLRRFARTSLNSASSIVPYACHVDRGTLRTRDGEYVRSWSLRGMPFETSGVAEVGERHSAWNQLVRSLGGGEIAFWTHKVRTRISLKRVAVSASGFGAALTKSYQSRLETPPLLENQLYLSVVYRPASAAARPTRRAGVDAAVFRQSEQRVLARMDEIALQIESGLADCVPRALVTYEKRGIAYSEALGLFSLLLNGWREEIPLPSGPIYDALPHSRLLFGLERLEIRAPAHTRFGAMLDLKDYPTWTEPGILNALLYGDFEYIETQSFSPLAAGDARTYLERQRNHLLTANDLGVSQVRALDTALDQLIGGAFVFGEYHYSLALLGDSVAEVNRALAESRVALLEQGFQTAVVDLVVDAAWFAQLPGNWRYRPRLARISSRNFCAMAPFHNFQTGKRTGNPWGEAVCILRTSHGGPYAFNFHATPDGIDSFGDKAPGNTMIIGQTGSGKTVLELFLIAQALKFAPRVVILDKDRGAETAVRAMGGRYRLIKFGEPTGLNPFALEANPENVAFWELLVHKLVELGGVAPDSLESLELSRAIQTIAQFPSEKRSVATLLQNLVSANSRRVSEALARWSHHGPMAWVLDERSAALKFDDVSLIGVDYTEILEQPEARTVVVMLLIHLIEQSLDGGRFIYVIAEFWKALDDPVFAEFVRNKQKTIRKQNGFGIFDTQSPVDVLNSPIARTLVEQTATLIFLPNPRADRDDYVLGFKLTDDEFEVIRRLDSRSHMFLVKQAGRSVLARLDLSGMRDELSILSATTDSLRRLDACRAQFGDAPESWLPHFLAAQADARSSVTRSAES